MQHNHMLSLFFGGLFFLFVLIWQWRGRQETGGGRRICNAFSVLNQNHDISLTLTKCVPKYNYRKV